MRNEDWVSAGLGKLRERSLFREPRVYAGTGGSLRVGDRTYLNFSSNDYLGLSRHPAVLGGARRALERYGAGATASRLITGTLDLHEVLEAKLAEFKGAPAALVFGSGALANLGTLPALLGRDLHVFADRLAHGSILDGILLSRARLHRFHHNDMAHLAALLRRHGVGERRLVVTESVFSMDGDLAPLPELIATAREHEALLFIDDAHAVGVFGEAGAGRVGRSEFEGGVNVCVGTFSKALGSYGGFVTCSRRMRDWFVNAARTFVFSTALPPPVLGAAAAAVDLVRAEPRLGQELLRRAARLRARLAAGGIDTGLSASQIVPVRVGPSAAALRVSRALRKRGVLAVAIRPPTVPEGTARLRLSVSLAHTEADLDRASQCVCGALREEGLL